MKRVICKETFPIRDPVFTSKAIRLMIREGENMLEAKRCGLGISSNSFGPKFERKHNSYITKCEANSFMCACYQSV